MSEIKMIVTDLDGTLLREDKTISERSLHAIMSCRAKGIKVIFATGRGGSADAFAPIELFDGYIFMNGAIAYIGDKLIYSKLMQIEKVRDLLVAANDAGINTSVERNGIHYANFNVTKKWPWIPYYEETDFRKLDIEVEKASAIAETPEVRELVTKYMPDGAYAVFSRDDLAMVMHKDAVKSKAVAAMAEYWNIRRHEIVAFGDDINDSDMLRYCGIGVAMENALDEVKTAADCICESNDNDGFAKWIEENVLA